ncbi:VanZ family protein [Corynebacterium lowii]|uniref:VanZ like family protein n=1 Tax=Corynebacterium lowii TaxID=1544413 RepID=A0A0Q0U4X8_9CORY|nr:VanZ family protein [Corynebacterium lowii]KQB86997.1 VanZ like family protein [Corynebacterium lowii]MDP9852422.1 glycopeptide antibiotics resistance protein [Corynebacterium lowii]
MLFSTDERRSGTRTILFAVYAAALFAATLLKGQLSIGDVWDVESHHQRSIDVELFNGFSDAPVWWGPWLNTVGNVALFIPLGVFVALAWNEGTGRSLLRAGGVGALTSAVIETAQYVFAVGYSDVDDLVCNTVGAVMGAWGARRVVQSRMIQRQGELSAR